MSAEEELAGLLEEGKALLRRGRELSRGGYDYGEADAALQDAMACFEEASALDPASTKVLVRRNCMPWCAVKGSACAASYCFASQAFSRLHVR